MFSGHSVEENRKVWFSCETHNIKEMIRLFIGYSTHDQDEDILLENMVTTFKTLCDEPIIMNIVFTKLVYLFSINNMIIDSEFLNILIFMCLVEDIFKKTNLFSLKKRKILMQ